MFREYDDYAEFHAEQERARKGRRDWFVTATGRTVFVMAPELSEIAIEDIALSLSRQCRFAGHLRHDVDHYSVAQHSVVVSQIVSDQHELIGLLHDATEAYTQDIIRPLKHVLGTPYRELERAWAVRIGDVFGLGESLAELPADVKAADEVALMTERRDLLVPRPDWSPRAEPLSWRIEPLGPRAARREFLARFYELRLDPPSAWAKAVVT